MPSVFIKRTRRHELLEKSATEGHGNNNLSRMCGGGRTNSPILSALSKVVFE